MQLNDSIRALVATHNVKKSEICKYANMDPTTFRRFLNGESNLSSDKLLKVLEYCEIDLPNIIHNHISGYHYENIEKNRKGKNFLYLIDKGLNKVEKRTLIRQVIKLAKQSFKKKKDPKIERIISEVLTEAN